MILVFEVVTLLLLCVDIELIESFQSISSYDKYAVRRRLNKNITKSHHVLCSVEDELNSSDRNSEGDSDDMRRLIEKEVIENAPNGLEVRMRLMGFNPITIFGYCVAFILILLNTVLGTGWASNILNGSNVISNSNGDVQQSYDREQMDSRMKELKGDVVINYDDIYSRLEELHRSSHPNQ